MSGNNRSRTFFDDNSRFYDGENDDWDTDDPYWYEDDTTVNPGKENAVTQSTNPTWNVSFWELVTLVTSLLCLFLLVYVMVKIYQKGLLSTNHRSVYLISTLIGCFLSGIIVITEVIWGLLKDADATHSWQLCFYIEVVKLTVLDWIGTCLVLTFLNTLYCVYSIRDDTETDESSQRVFVHISNVLSVVVLCIVNSAPEHFYNDFPTTVSSCSKQEVFISHIDLIARIDLVVKLIVIIVTIAAMLSVIIVIKYKLMAKIVDEFSNGQREMGVKHLDILSNRSPIEDMGFECQSISSDLSLCDNEQTTRLKPQQPSDQPAPSPSVSCFSRYKRSKCKKQAELNVGFTVEMGEAQHVSSHRSERVLAKRSLSLNATQESYVRNWSPMTRQKASSVQYLDEHVLQALDNFFISDPALMQADFKTQQRNVEQSETLIELETAFSMSSEHLSTTRRNSRKRKMRKVSWKDLHMKQKSRKATSEKRKTIKAHVEDDLTGASDMDKLALVEHQQSNQDCFEREDLDVVVTKSDASNQNADEAETSVNQRDRKGSVISVEVEVHRESYAECRRIDSASDVKATSNNKDRKKVDEPERPNNVSINSDMKNSDSCSLGKRNKYMDVTVEINKTVNMEKEKNSMAEGLKPKEITDKHADQSMPRLFDNLDQSEVTNKETNQSASASEDGSQSLPMNENINQSDCSKDEAHTEPTGSETEEEMKVEIAETESEQITMDDPELTEILTYKENLKMMGKMAHTVAWLSLIYIVFALLSASYAMLVMSDGVQTASSETFKLLVDISKGGQVTFILLYTSVFAWRFGLFRKYARK